MITYTTINREIGAWIQEFREPWMKQDNYGWDGKKRFGCALVGSIISVLTIVLSRIPELDISVLDFSGVGLIFVFLVFLLLSVPFIIWFS